MECPNCSFQNVPGTLACVRCRCPLDLRNVDFIPPRAARGRAGRQVRVAAASARFRTCEVLSEAGRSIRSGTEIPVRWRDVPWLIVPGGVQVRAAARGLRLLGWLTLGAWCLLMFLALVTVGDAPSRLLALAAVSVHSFSVSLALARLLQAWAIFTRLAFGLALYFGLLYGLYLPARSGLLNCAGVLPVAGVQRQPALADGDVLIHSGRWLRPQAWNRGDLVIAAIEPSFAAGVAIRGGTVVDRLIALPGDVVHMERGVLTVNDCAVPRNRQPIAGLGELPTLDVTLEPGQYLVYPSAFRWTGHGQWQPAAAQATQRLCVIDERGLLGRVWFRVRPWSRVGVPGSIQP